MKTTTILATLGTALAATLGATAGPAQAAVSSASIDGLTATLDLDGADDNVTVSVSGGLLVHGQTTGGLNSGSDWNSAAAGDQTRPTGHSPRSSTGATATTRSLWSPRAPSSPALGWAAMAATTC